MCEHCEAQIKEISNQPFYGKMLELKQRLEAFMELNATLIDEASMPSNEEYDLTDPLVLKINRQHTMSTALGMVAHGTLGDKNDLAEVAQMIEALSDSFIAGVKLDHITFGAVQYAAKSATKQ